MPDIQKELKEIIDKTVVLGKDAARKLLEEKGGWISKGELINSLGIVYSSVMSRVIVESMIQRGELQQKKKRAGFLETVFLMQN